MNANTSNDEAGPLLESEAARLVQLRLLLDTAEIQYAILVHAQNLASSEDGAQSGLGTLSDMAPTFILRTEAGYFAAIVRGDTRLSYKKIKQKLGLKNVSLAAPDLVQELTGSGVGCVSLIQPGIPTLLDERVMQVETIYGGSGLPNHTLQISPQALAALTQARVFDFTELKEQGQ